MIIRKIHFISGLIIAVFTGLHLFNHFCSIFGADKHIEVMDVLRYFYRNIVVEAVLLMAVFVQIVSGLKLFRIHKKIAVTSFEKLHVWTGLYLAIFFVLHLTAVFGGRYLLHLDTNFYFGVAGLNTFPFYLFFVPYYGLAILSFFGHVASIHSKKIKSTVAGMTPNHQAKAILIVGIIFTLIIFYGSTNRFQGVQIPEEYNILIGK